MTLNKVAPKLYGNIKKIEEELNKYKNIQREDLLKSCITNKLAGTLERYNEEIDLNSDYLLTRSSTKVLKALTKLQKKQDKEILEENESEDFSSNDDFNLKQKEINWDD